MDDDAPPPLLPPTAAGRQKLNEFAAASLVLGFLSLFVLQLLLGCLAIFSGVAALVRMRGIGQKMGGHRLAIAGITLGALVVLAGALESLDSSKSPREIAQAPKQRTHLHEVSATELLNAFEDNAVAARRRYIEKFVRVSGSVFSIDDDFGGSPKVVLYAGAVLGSVNCEFPGSAAIALSRLSKGDEVEIEGKVYGYFSSVKLSDCRLVSPLPEK